ncbi:hypothetical protein MVEN_00187900 [Mycena venus]|uniref:Protein kinase domain-containing protein n=1 Tax=Mycena venus TaxID=2733690 RepID=A0A8H7DD74_9AGAR|nr:hypothetical protein MVEN_00187900 [Mycena venus]
MQAQPETRAGAFFSRSRNFVVSGGNFTSVHNHLVAPGPSDFRIIPLGDLDLQNEINGPGTVSRRHGTDVRRKMYSVKIWQSSSDRRTSAAMYTGKDAEQNWERDLAVYSGIRHPNFLQVHGLVKAHGIYATVFHDDLIPLAELFSFYAGSTITTTYLHWYIYREFWDAGDYFKDISGKWLGDQSYMPWIRRSTGRLAVDIAPSAPEEKIDSICYILQGISVCFLPPPLLGPDPVAKIISSLSLEDYHSLVDAGRKVNFLHGWSYATHERVRLGLLFRGEMQNVPEIGYEVNPSFTIWPWMRNSRLSRESGEILPNGWTRFSISDILTETEPASNLELIIFQNRKPWISQANYIFNLLQITCEHEQYVVIDRVDFHIYFHHGADTPPPGYIFLCPQAHFQTGDGRFWKPANPAYWAFDELGAEPLDTDQAEALGFPSITFHMGVVGNHWPSSAYEGVREFHRRKGFDPESQDVAKHLGYSLWEIASDHKPTFAHIDEMSDAHMRDTVGPDDEDRMILD